MTKEEIVERLQQGEDSRTQFKAGPIGVAKLAMELAAFSNAAGGVIFFGVDDGGRIVGLDAETRKRLNEELSNASNDNVRPAVYPHTEYHTIDGKIMLVVSVPEGVAKPYSDKTGCFWPKAGPDKRRITAREELQRMLQRSFLVYADELPVAGTSVRDIDVLHFGEFIERNYNIPKAEAFPGGTADVPKLLSNLGLLKDGQLTLAGLMLFGKDPQFYRRIEVAKCVWFAGNDVSGSTYLDSEDLTGTIRDLFRGIMSFLNRTIRKVQGGQNFNSIGIPEVPLEALEEYVVNMLLHRDYFVTSPWRVFVFDDRIELISPGSLPNHLSVEQMKSGVSVPRNPVLFSLAVKDGLPYRGIGSGIKRAMGLYPKVEFINDPDGFLLTTIVPFCFVRTGETVKPKNETVNETINAGETINETVKPKNETVNETINEDETVNAMVFELIRQHAGICSREIIERLGRSRATIMRYLSMLKTEGRIEFRGAPKTGGYYVIGE